MIMNFTDSEVSIALIQTIISTLLVLISAEFLPKTIFRINPNQTLNIFAIPVQLFYWLLYPVVIVTIGLSIFIRHLYLLFATGKVQNFPLELQRRQTYLFFDMTPRNLKVLIIGILVMILIGLLLTYTKLGKAMRAVRDSEELSSVSGINSDNIILITWISSSMLAGLAGVFQATINDVRWNMGFLILLLIFAGTVLGGIGTSFGAMVGGLIIGILVQVSVGLPFMEGHTEAKNAVALGIMIVILLFRPQGIFGQKERIS